MNTDHCAGPMPSSSRMLAGYLSDIEELLDKQRWDVALREAADLPLIAAALTDPQLRSSQERVRSWCQEWISDHTQDGRVGQRIARLNPPDATATRALRRLRLRRDFPSRPRGFPVPRARNLAPQDTETAETCTVLLDATRRWYARHACHDAGVQNNLARLAVLR